MLELKRHSQARQVAVATHLSIGKALSDIHKRFNCMQNIKASYEFNWLD